MPKSRLQVISRKILADLLVFKPEMENAAPVRTKALFDTGAMNSCITSALARELESVPTSKILVAGVHGVKDCNAHTLKIGIPFQSQENKTVIECLDEIEVFEIDDNPEWNMIVGMDIIQQGVLVVDGDQCVFSL
ncbi:MAG: hypothetical protein FWF96_00905 [Kiritimatiellaeota bacterium]|nr:hypothetical protein [Kiritimatiellota bacterium]